MIPKDVLWRRVFTELSESHKEKIMAAKSSFLIAALFFTHWLQAGGPPDWLSIAPGVYDLMRERHRTDEFEIEYKFHVRRWSSPFQCLEFLPLVGLMANIQRGGYLYTGLNFDFVFFKHLHFAPGFAAGYYWPGKGKNLGFPLEFRSGIELGWQFSDFRRLGVHFYHLSNASLGKRNPGEESLVLYFDIPITKGFPFHTSSSNKNTP
jgi:lipid A 3-O-deacylase